MHIYTSNHAGIEATYVHQQKTLKIGQALVSAFFWSEIYIYIHLCITY